MVDSDFESERLLQNDIKDKARELIGALDSGNLPVVRTLIGTLAQIKEESLFQELGKLSKDLDATIKEINVDIAENEITNARIRLNDVIAMTEAAANKTMDCIDATIPMSNNLGAQAKELLLEWEKFRRRELDVKEFNVLYTEMMGFLEQVEQTSKSIQKNLQDMLVAQNYQDLSGQAIKKVILVVAKVEEKLVRLVAISAKMNASFAGPTEAPIEKISAEKRFRDKENTGVVSGQDEVDDLFSNLGL